MYRNFANLLFLQHYLFRHECVYRRVLAERVGHSVFKNSSLIISTIQYSSARFLYHTFVPIFHGTTLSLVPLR